MRKLAAIAIITAAAASAWGQPAPGTGGEKPVNYTLSNHSDSMYAAELLRLNQPAIVKTELGASKGKPSENLWKAEDIYLSWDEIAKNPLDAKRAGGEYLAAVKTYLESQTSGIDGVWALAQAKFCFARLSDPIVNRIEYFGSTAKDRAELLPVAQLIDGLLKQADISIKAALAEAEKKQPFDEAAYMRVYGAQDEVAYYAAMGLYVRGLAMDPADPERRKAFTAAAQALSKWADDENDNGVNGLATLARGKALGEAGQTAKAIKDFEKAMQTPNTPEWVGFQARYQSVVARLRGGDFQGAVSAFKTFKAGLPQNNLQAQLSADMLGFRVAWAVSEQDHGDIKVQEQKQALAILTDVMKREPRLRKAVFEQIALTIPDGADPASFLPLQQLALAYGKSDGQDGKAPESKAALNEALKSALLARGNALAEETDKKEAAYLAATIATRLEDHDAAAKYCLEFAELAKEDPRAKGAVDQALVEINTLRKTKADSGGLTEEERDIADRALAISAGRFGQKELQFNRGLLLKEAKKFDEARKVFESITEDDKNYFSARYQLVLLSTDQYSAIAVKGDPTATQKAGNDLIQACMNLELTLENPSPNTPKEMIEQAKAYQKNLWLLEVGTAVNPAVRNSKLAMDRLDKLEAVQNSLTDAQKGLLLRYRILMYQNEGNTAKALESVQVYAKSHGQDAIALIKGIVSSTLQEFTDTERTNPEAARTQADFLVKLLDSLIEASTKEGKKDDVFELKLAQSELLVKAGKFADARRLAEELQKERDTDLRTFMADARARYGQAKQTGDKQQYAEVQDYFTRILPRITPGADSYWECWLRVIECMEVLKGPDAREDIKKRLSDLKAVSGDNFGGKDYKADFANLAARYGVD